MTLLSVSEPGFAGWYVTPTVPVRLKRCDFPTPPVGKNLYYFCVFMYLTLFFKLKFLTYLKELEL